jgi:hypothetical protein
VNERIKELAEFHSINVDVMQAIYDDIALLIVRECIDIGDNYQDILGDEPECVNCRKVAYGIVDKIKQHFGVEE